MFTAAALTAFFESVDQMGIVNRTRLEMQRDGITHPEHLAEFTEEGFKALFSNLARPGGRVPNPDPGADAGAMIHTPRFVLGVKSQLRLKAAANLVRYYQTCSRDITAPMMQWDPMIKYHSEYWTMFEKSIEDSEPELPKITKALPIMRWAEAFVNHLSRVLGVRSIPLTYVIRANVAVADPPPPLTANKPFSAEHGSVPADMVALASHTHACFSLDNATVYHLLVAATQATQYAASVTPFDASKDGRGAYLALTRQFAGPDKWREELRKQKEVLTRKWTGRSSITLETFCSHHRHAHVLMSQCSQHIHVELPTGYTRVEALLEAIECDDASLQAALAQIRTDESATGPHHDFEAAVTIIVPQCPVARKRGVSGKRANAQISSMTGIGGAKPRIGTGKTGVPLRFHVTKEFVKLTSAQKQELNQHRDDREAAGLGRDLPVLDKDLKAMNAQKRPKKKKQKHDKTMAMVSAAIAAADRKAKSPAALAKKATEAATIEAFHEFLAQRDTPVASGAVGSATAVDPARTADVAAKSSALVLTSILRNAKRG
jgi:hypothetical protein